MTTTRNLAMTRTDDGEVLLELDGAAVGCVDLSQVLVAMVDVLNFYDVADAARMLAATR
ncbi:hypothetical protein [Cellulosimicrobium cellulans]|uniref:hypothetical protein n=1 Tax=Cellulosimicrobium cellulans TaxID=1710 RepID=UPI0024050FA0|nr:hypothetical protein [Cellulosimicrobium cellulans]MDF9874818.1 hypothetical protein [Cellulosimicrobium cellulans]